MLTTTSPRRISGVLSPSLLGTPPPIPTMRPKAIEGNVEVICETTAAAEIVPYTPEGKQATTILCPLTFPSV
jgi:hypothetical protein